MEPRSHRECPFCDQASSEPRYFGRRHGAVFLRCGECRSVYMDLSSEQFERLHDASFQDDAFIADITAIHGVAPDRRAWNELEQVLGPGSVLEIGPGTGHVLAAAALAGREVAGVEASRSHREFIRKTWGISDVYASLDELPADRRYANVIMVNVLEHVYDVAALMSRLRGHLTRDARVFVSTVNARGILGSLAGTYWSMFKPQDHVSFPSVESLQHLASRTGYRLARGWSAELPLETPLGLLVALRDYLQERRRKPDTDPPPATSAGAAPSANRKVRKRLLWFVYRAAEHVDPSRHALASLQRASTVKGVFVPVS